MTAKTYLWAWATALSVAAVLVWFVHSDLGRGTLFEQCQIPDGTQPPRRVAIGSSLSGHGFGLSQDRPPSEIYSDFAVWSTGNLDSETALDLVRCAIALDVQTVFIEANTFVFSEVLRPDEVSTGQSDFLRTLNSRLHGFTNKVRSIARPKVDLAQFEEPAQLRNLPLKQQQVWDGTRPEVVELPYGMIDKQPSRDLADLSEGIEIILFEPPRTTLQIEDTEAFLGISFAREISNFAENSGLPVLKFWPAWQPSEFREYQSHLNTSGRRRFVQEFQTAWDAFNDAR